MKRYPFLLLDAGPIIKLFQLGIWDDFITKCDVTISSIVAEEAQYASREDYDVCINIESYREQGLVRIIDVDLSKVKTFHDQFDRLYRAIIHPGEKETLAFLLHASEDWMVCSSDGAVFRVLGLLGRAEQGISLEEVLIQIGLSRQLKWQYTKNFRERYTRMGQIDSIQGDSRS